MVSTRGPHDTVPVRPPALVRMSALRKVRFTHDGRRHARKILLDPYADYLFYVSTSALDNVSTYYLAQHTPCGQVRRRFASRTQIPAFDYVA